MEEEYPVKSLNCINITNIMRFPIEMFAVQEYVKQYVDYVMITNGTIKDRIAKLAQDIFNAYRLEASLTFIVVLNGADMYFNELMGVLRKLLSFDKTCQLVISIEYVKVAKNIPEGSTEPIENLKNPELITGKNILILEDIYGSGASMQKRTEYFFNLHPKSLKTSVLLLKKNPANLIQKWKPDFIGFAIPDRFVIGYYMDYNNLFREIPHLCVLNAAALEKFKTGGNIPPSPVKEQ